MKLNALMVRYIVNDVAAAITFYSNNLDFRSPLNQVRTSQLFRARTCNSCSAPRRDPEEGRNRCPTAEDLNRVDGIE
jgi:hypothetical protein